MALRDIETIVFVMLENRSFDHALGYLSTQAANPPLAVEGLRDDPAWLDAHANNYAGHRYLLHPIGPEIQRIEDPPHDHAAIAIQIGTASGSDGSGLMGGFVASYMTRHPPPADPSRVMGYYTQATVPMFDFFARNFVVCDHWFAALPTGTQANRLMAMSGSSRILDNASVFLPDQSLVYDWLTAHKVSWCAYQWGDFFPFFSLMARWLPEMVTSLTFSGSGPRGRFRRYAHFREHWASSATMPSVIFVEPEYTDGPHAYPNDDHPPTGIAKGQALLADLYATLTSNPTRWRNTMLIVTYDEHGGFYDHVPPLNIGTTVGGFPIATTGVRVPAFIVSPHVAPGVPFSDALDHTSFLQLLADRFNPGQGYSADVSARQARLGRLSTVLTQTPSDRPDPPAPVGATTQLTASLPASSGVADSPSAARTAQGFHNVALKVAADHPDLLTAPGWSRLRSYLAGS
jgi:phospholipase C